MQTLQLRRILAVALLCAMALCLFGCSKKVDAPAETTKAAEEVAEEAEAAVEEVAETAEETVEEVAEEAEAAVEEVAEEAEATVEEATEEAEAAVEEVAEEAAQPAGDGEALDDVTVAGWHIVAGNVQVNSSLDNISVALGYSGIETSEYSKTADEGMTFCMIKLLIEKQGSKETIDWENMLLTDGDGNEYHRIADEFILDLGMKRMPGTKLNFGSNEGWIAYQIPEGAGGLTLSYAFEAETYSLALGI